MTPGEAMPKEVDMAWIIESTVQYKDMKTPHVSYWYGPKHGWGTTWGSRDDFSVAEFPTRKAAENAFRSVRPLRASRGEKAVRR